MGHVQMIGTLEENEVNVSNPSEWIQVNTFEPQYFISLFIQGGWIS